MSDFVIDSSVVAKWILPESDSAQAQQIITQSISSGGQMLVLDLVFPEVANAIWKRQRQKLITLDEAMSFVGALSRIPVRVEPAASLLVPALEIAAKYDRAVYDALFVALARRHRLTGITADEPLFHAVHKDFPEISLLRDL